MVLECYRRVVAYASAMVLECYRRGMAYGCGICNSYGLEFCHRGVVRGCGTWIWHMKQLWLRVWCANALQVS